MNKLILAMALCAALVACKKDDATATDMAPAADTAAAPAADTAAADTAAAPVADTAPDATAAAAPVNAGLPKECEDFLNRAKACFAKASPQMAAQFQMSIDQSKAQWESMSGTNAAGATQACKQANDQFAQTATALKCE